MATCMGMPILKSGTFLLVESGILKICLVESGILGFAIWNTAQGIRNPTEDCNPESMFHWQRIRNPRCGIQNPRLFEISLHTAKWKNGGVNSLPTHDIGMSPPTYIFAITRDYQMHNPFLIKFLLWMTPEKLKENDNAFCPLQNFIRQAENK